MLPINWSTQQLFKNFSQKPLLTVTTVTQWIRNNYFLATHLKYCRLFHTFPATFAVYLQNVDIQNLMFWLWLTKTNNVCKAMTKSNSLVSSRFCYFVAFYDVMIPEKCSWGSYILKKNVSLWKSVFFLLIHNTDL